MKLGVITDIHNNLTALKYVMAELNQMKCDKIICCGDIIGIGPYPEETVQYMMQIPNLIAVCGNHEKYLLEGMPNEYPNEEQMGFEEMKHHKWEHRICYNIYVFCKQSFYLFFIYFFMNINISAPKIPPRVL